ncbi:COG5 [Lepeophtheirus salmonis]|uniref:Conserved oligomeric Golgi complex subunit 5 n=1 Tax=Lepeophtheirus salmonis TaxID=72036 RepID=A0A7R8CHL3_LEPSM|nr:COG5 [Lepeophtheirus salmonis]CAF2781575.1 COG5 [Lepeophtheirus salmonis]
MVNLSRVESIIGGAHFDAEKKTAVDVILGREGSLTLSELEKASESVESRIRNEVSSRYDSLLDSATKLKDLRASAEALKSRSSMLKASGDRIKAKISDPYVRIRDQTLTLTRMQNACDSLRRVIRILQLITKLQGKLESSKEIAGAAAALAELSEIWTPDLEGIEVLDQKERFVLGARHENQSSIGTALHVYYNLGVLETAVREKVLTKAIKDVGEKINDSLNAKKITESLYDTAPQGHNGGSGGHQAGSAVRASSLLPTGNMPAFRAVLWNNVEGISETVYTKTLELITTQRILCKKRDALTHVSFIETMSEGSRNIVADFWEANLKNLRENLVSASGHSHFIKQSLEGDMHPGELPVPLKNPFDSSMSSTALRDTLTSFERAYLSRSLSRLFDPIDLMFSKSNSGAMDGEGSTPQSIDIDIPTEEDIAELCGIVSSELQISAIDERLSQAISKNIVQGVHLFATKCETLLVTDGEASQVIGYPTSGQKRNVKIVNTLHTFKSGIFNTIGSWDHSSTVKSSLSHIDVVANAAVAPLFSSIRDAVESIIFNSSFRTELKKELQAFISRVSVDYLNGFLCKEFISSNIKPLVDETIELFILHASLVRPLPKEAQHALTSDCAQLELTLEPLSPKIKSSGLSYDRLRAFRALLYIQPEDMVNSLPQIGSEVLPASTIGVLHDTLNGLEDHPSEKDRLQLIQGALESYVASTRQRNDKSYAYPYPVMLNILQKVMA